MVAAGRRPRSLPSLDKSRASYVLLAMSERRLVSHGSLQFVWLGSDSVAYLSEEVENAARIVPQSIILGYLINGPLGLAMAFTLAYSYGPIDAEPLGTFPYVSLLHRTLGNSRATTVVIAVVMVLLATVTLSVRAVRSRVTLVNELRLLTRGLRKCAKTPSQAFAFVTPSLVPDQDVANPQYRRDNGLPCSQWIRHTNSKLNAPVRGAVFSGCLTVALSLLTLGNTSAFSTVLSLAAASLMATYILTLACVLSKRLRREPLPTAQWSLGRAGIAVNALGLAYACWAFFWCLWPAHYAVTASNFNWAPVLLVGLMGIAYAVFTTAVGSKYQGPVQRVQTWINS
ncbi:hypothetical protein LTR53_003651 [Teratosphaeriaceae sp. CCFEE 6253]|nr:hypothetical protein LTR53_003651 [Teratosphaeriaceae sp. CCFEE 6253]